jgi:CheY-like chemotaxis protein
MSPKKPGQKGDENLPLLLIVDADLGRRIKGPDDILLKPTAPTSMIKNALKRKLQGIVIQVDPSDTGKCSAGLNIGATIRLESDGTAPMVFVSKNGAVCPHTPPHSNYAHYKNLLHNRGSMTWTDGKLSRMALWEVLTEIPHLDEAARMDLVINSISLGGYITELMVHELPKEVSRERACDALMLLAKALGNGPQVAESLTSAIAASAAKNGSMPVENVGAMVQLLGGKETADGQPNVALEGCNILLVEDEPDYGQRIEKKLRDLGAEVKLTHSGREAADMLAQKDHEYNALITDWRLKELDGTIQIHRQGFELIRLCDPRITSRISLTRMDLRSIAVIRNAIPKDQLPDFKVYPKDEVDRSEVIWKLLIQDLHSGARWSEHCIRELMSGSGMVGHARWPDWKDYFMRRSNHGFADFIAPIDARATVWWGEIEGTLPKTKEERKKTLRSIDLPESVMYGSNKESETDNLESMLVVRRIVFGLLSWGHTYHFDKVGAVEMDEVTKWVMEKFKAGDKPKELMKNFLNTKLCIGTRAFGKQGNGLLQDEKAWLVGEELTLDFAETKARP